jgi:L-alanine-DL-glutamate epimerase-like enolase superfamily enzyme
MNQAIAPSFSTGQPICKAGLDLALLDLGGRLTRQSVACSLEGLGKKRLTISWTLNPRTLDEVEPLIAEGKKAGYQNFNIKVAPDPKFDLGTRPHRKAIGPRRLSVGRCQWRYDEATATEVIPRLAEAELPSSSNRCRRIAWGAYRRLKKQGALPIIMDEGIVSSVELEEFIDLKLLDGVAMKPARCWRPHRGSASN